MSLRIDTSEWISGSLIIGDIGGGVIGSLIPSGGESGAGYTYNDLSLPADATKEICGRITTWPSAGTLFAYEDTSFEFTGAPNGVYTFQYQLYVDYVAVGSPTTVTLTVGGTTHAATGALSASAATLAGVSARIGAPLIHAATGAMTAGAAAIYGTAAIRVTHAATGELVAGYSMLSGSAAIRVIHEASGDLFASNALISGSAYRSDESENTRFARKIFVKGSSVQQISIRQSGQSSITVLRRSRKY